MAEVAAQLHELRKRLELLGKTESLLQLEKTDTEPRGGHGSAVCLGSDQVYYLYNQKKEASLPTMRSSPSILKLGIPSTECFESSRIDLIWSSSTVRAKVTGSLDICMWTTLGERERAEAHYTSSYGQ